MRWSSRECVGAPGSALEPPGSALELQGVRWSSRECVGAPGSSLELQGVRWSSTQARRIASESSKEREDFSTCCVAIVSERL